MRSSVEMCGVHGPSEALAQLKRELLLLSKSRQPQLASASEVPSEILVEASNTCRIDGELVATKLQLEYEVNQLELSQSIQADISSKHQVRVCFEESELEGRGQIGEAFWQSLQQIGTEAAKGAVRAARAEYVRKCNETTAKKAQDLLSHDRILNQLDEAEFREDRRRIAKEWKLREIERRLAEGEERERLAAIRQAGRLEDVPFVYNELDLGLPV